MKRKNKNFIGSYIKCESLIPKHLTDTIYYEIVEEQMHGDKLMYKLKDRSTEMRFHYEIDGHGLWISRFELFSILKHNKTQSLDYISEEAEIIDKEQYIMEKLR